MKARLLTEEQKSLFKGTLLLSYMADHEKEFDVLLLGGSGDLETILTWLLSRELVEISKTHHYRISTSGYSAVQAFEKRYLRLLQYFEVFSAVDLEEGRFAFAEYSEHQSNSSWIRFLDDDRWEDLRIPMAEYLGADPIELLCAHFMKESRVDLKEAGWEAELNHGSLMWNEIEEICQSSLKIEDLGYEDVSGKDVLGEVVEEGFLLVRRLSDFDPNIMGHLARWSPSRQVDDYPPDQSEEPFWKTRWSLDLPA